MFRQNHLGDFNADEKSSKGLGALGAAGLLVYNGWLLSYDIACHKQYPDCDYQFEAVGPTGPTGPAFVLAQGPSFETASDTGPMGLAGARNLAEVMELQAAYWSKLLGKFRTQAASSKARVPSRNR